MEIQFLSKVDRLPLNFLSFALCFQTNHVASVTGCALLAMQQPPPPPPSMHCPLHCSLNCCGCFPRTGDTKQPEVQLMHRSAVKSGLKQQRTGSNVLLRH